MCVSKTVGSGSRLCSCPHVTQQRLFHAAVPRARGWCKGGRAGRPCWEDREMTTCNPNMGVTGDQYRLECEIDLLAGAEWARKGMRENGKRGPRADRLSFDSAQPQRRRGRPNLNHPTRMLPCSAPCATGAGKHHQGQTVLSLNTLTTSTSHSPSVVREVFTRQPLRS